MPTFPARAHAASAVDRTTCVLGLALGIAGFAFIGIEYPSARAQMAANPLWWLVPALLVVPGMYGAMIVASVAGSGRAVRLLCGVYPVLYLPIALTIPLAFERQSLPPMHFPWPLLVGSGTIITSSFVQPMRRVVVLAACYAPLHALAVHWCQYDVTWGWAAREGVSIAMIGVIFAAVVRSVSRNAHTIDRQAGAVRAAALRRARATAIGQERERVDALVHDTVVSTFVAALTKAPAESVRASARASLAALDQLGEDDDGAGTLDGAEFAARLRQVATDTSDTITTTEHDHSGGAQYPVEVARLFQEVIAEAARNSVRHAGPSARRTLRTELFPDFAAATFADDGVGFNPDEVPPLRLGINTAMRARVSHIPGAAISIDSAVGRGARISVRWRRHG